MREQYLQQAKSGRKVTYKDLRETIERERPDKVTVEVLATDGLKTTHKPEIISLIPQGSVANRTGASAQVNPEVDTIDVAAVAESIAQIPIVQMSVQPSTLQASWYLLDQQHFIFCGDTASPDFYGSIPEAAFALAATAEDWDHDWLVEAAKTVTILPETTLQQGMIEQLITLFSQPTETVIFPWLPNPNMIAIAHRLGRKVVAGDLSPKRCQQAIRAAQLPVVKIDL